MRVGVLFWLSAIGIASSLLFGGGTRPGFVSDVAVQIVAIPLLVAALWNLPELESVPAEFKHACWLCAGLVVIPVLQLIPLPPAIWTTLPGKAIEESAFQLMGRDLPWLTASAAPRATWLSLVALVPPLAIFLSTAQLSYRERRWLSLLILGIGSVGVFIGLMQVAQGPSSPLRFFEITNPTEAVGFFANRNHYAAFLYVLMVLAAAWAVNSAPAFGLGSGRNSTITTSAFGLIAGFTAIVVLLGAQAMARSRAGLGLAVLGLFGAFAMGYKIKRSEASATPLRLLIGATVVAVIFSLQFAVYRILERFTSDPLEDARIKFAHSTIEAAKAYMPFGSGMGSFVPVFAVFEAPEGLLASFANRAHDDFLEFWLEAGALGIVLMIAFAIWFLSRTVSLWRQKSSRGRDLDRTLARGATLVVALLVAHSAVDYPLRTAALMAIFAFACGLLITPPDGLGRENAEEDEGPFEEAAPRGKHNYAASAAPIPVAPRSTSTFTPWAPPSGHESSDFKPWTPDPVTPPLSGQKPGDLWGENVDWPDEWRTPGSGRGSPGKPRR
jgi:O-antigen ligase